MELVHCRPLGLRSSVLVLPPQLCELHSAAAGIEQSLRFYNWLDDSLCFGTKKKDTGAREKQCREHRPIVVGGAVARAWAHRMCIFPKHSAWFESAFNPVIPSRSVSNFLEAKPLNGLFPL